MTATPCFGHTELFDSTNPHDHTTAQKVCLGLRRPDGSQITAPCFFLAGCKKLLDATREEYGVHNGPEGTWAGELVLAGGARAAEKQRKLLQAHATADHMGAERIAFEEEFFSVQDGRDAHNAYQRGDRDDWTCAGNRTYERRRAAAKRAAEKEQAA